MKKTTMFLAVIVGVLFSCSKEKENCNCGTVANDGISTNTDGSSCYWLEIRNECSGNKKTWCFDEDVWMNAAVGSNFCVDNVSNW
jgi:hypothetical protein